MSATEASQLSQLPIYRNAFDFDRLTREYPLPDVFEQTVWRWTPERIRALQEQRFLNLVEIGWTNPFYSRRWSAAGLRRNGLE